MIKSRPRKCRAEKNHKFLRVGIPFLMALDLLLVANCLGAHRHLREIESKPITEIRVVEKRVEVIKEVIRYINRKPSRATQAKSGASTEQWRALVAKYFPANQVDNCLKVMACESGGNPNASSPTNDHGLMQINKGLAMYGQQIYNPEFNIRLAYTNYYARRGWQPWSCARKVGLN
jgi:hypothetical protein